MALVVCLCTTNHPFGFDLLVTRELVPSFNVRYMYVCTQKRYSYVHQNRPSILLIQTYKFLLPTKNYAVCMYVCMYG